jgi:hypothetical protein
MDMKNKKMVSIYNKRKRREEKRREEKKRKEKKRKEKKRRRNTYKILSVF